MQLDSLSSIVYLVMLRSRHVRVDLRCWCLFIRILNDFICIRIVVTSLLMRVAVVGTSICSRIKHMVIFGLCSTLDIL